MSEKRIRQAVKKNEYEFSMHALEEMDNDNLTAEHVRDILLHGKIVAELTDDSRGTRLVVQGLVTRIKVEVVCRFLNLSRWLRIITVYVVEE